MTSGACATQEELLGWWLTELPPAMESRIDEHLFGCAGCAARLDALWRLRTGVRQAVRLGEFGFVVPHTFIQHMRDSGLSIREYTLSPGGSVNCTIAPQDDLVVANIQAPLAGAQRIDLCIDDEVLGKMVLEDVPFDAKSGALAVVPSAKFLRTLRHERQRMQVVAVQGGQRRVIGEYAFHHYPS